MTALNKATLLLLTQARKDLEALNLAVKHGARYEDKCWGIFRAEAMIADCEKELKARS